MIKCMFVNYIMEGKFYTDIKISIKINFKKYEQSVN